MSIIAIVIAAGQDTIGSENIPKPFVNVFDKPVLMYTLEVFESNPQIDYIELVCLEGWSEIARAYAKQFNITKLKNIVNGGQTIQESIFNGLKSLEGEADKDDIVIIHDGIRPMIETAVLTDVIQVAIEKGNSISSMPNNEQVFVVASGNPDTTNEFIPRETIKRVSTPQAYHFGEILDMYKTGFEKKIGIYGPSYADTLYVDMGMKLYFAAGSNKNIKINSEEEISIFEAYLNRDKDNYLK